MNDPISPAAVLEAPAEPPRSREAEMALLGSMIFSEDVIPEVLEVVPDPGWLAFARHRPIFRALQGLALERRPIDLVVLKEELVRTGELDAAGGTGYLAELVESLPTAANALEYARMVRDKFHLRTIIEACTRVVHRATHVTGDVDLVREEAERILFQALSRSEKSTVRDLAGLLEETLGRIRDLRAGKGGLAGLSTGFPDLDDLLGGLQAGQLVVAAGRPSMGKTSLALSVAERVALDQEVPVLVFSLEMAADQVVKSMLCSLARVDSNHLSKGHLSEADRRRLEEAAARLAGARILIDDSADLSALEVRARARRLKASEGIGLVVVDYLQKMHARSGERAAESRQVEISTISSQLKALAKELSVPVLALAQLNRAPEGREDRRPLLSDLRESGAIEQDADVVLLLYREEYYRPDTERSGVADVIVAKNRTGPTGAVELAFLKSFTRFENLSRVAG